MPLESTSLISGVLATRGVRGHASESFVEITVTTSFSTAAVFGCSESKTLSVDSSPAGYCTTLDLNQIRSNFEKPESG